MNIINEYNLALQYYNEGKLDVAEKAFLFCLTLQNDFFNAKFMLGNIYLQQQEFKQAIKIYKEVIKLNPQYMPTYNNIASIFVILKKNQKALKYLHLALEQNESCSNTLYNLANLYKQTLDLKKSKQYLKKLLNHEPNHALANFDLSYIYFLNKKYKKGFKYFEHRTSIPDEKHKYFYLPFNHLKKQSFRNKKLLVYHEQGFGDNIQFARFLNHEDFKNTKISYAVQNSLNKLFTYSFPNIKILSNVNANMDFDYDVPIMSLPYNLENCKIKQMQKYLSVDKNDIQYFKKEILNKKRFNIGLVWKGSSTQTEDKNRSISLKNFEKLYCNNYFKFYSLQIENKEELENISTIKDLGKDFKNFYDTAVAIKALDLVITVDTAIAHLAGALGKKCFVLHNKNVIDFRWAHSKKQSLWYKSITIFKYDKIENIMDTLYNKVLKVSKT